MYDLHELKQVINEFVPVFHDELSVDFSDELEDKNYSFNISICGKEYSFNHVLNDDDIKLQIKHLTKNDVYDALADYTGITIPWGSHTGVRPVALAVNLLGSMTEDEVVESLVKDYRMSEAKAKLCVDVATVQLPLLNDNECNIDIYISIPFCVSRCNYCSFSLVGIEKKKHLHEAYVKALCDEIRIVGQAVVKKGYVPRSIYFGGGTPTAISAELLDRILATTVSTFGNVNEFTIEAGRADTIDEDKLNVIDKYGITRFNINPQTMKDSTLVAIGRNHTSEDVLNSFKLARKHGHENINMDVIAGLPGETVEDFIYTIEEVLNQDPEDITVHTFALKRASRLKKQDYSIKGNSVADRMLEYAYGRLLEKGYHPYYLYRQKNMEDNGENVGFCKPGHECIYNIDIMQENTHILAMGSGAVSKKINGDTLIRRSDPKDIEVFIERIDDTISKSIEFFS